MGRVDDGLAIAEREDVDLHVLRRHDARAGNEGNAAGEQGRGADMRMVYSPLDALAYRRAESRQARVLLRDRLRDDGPFDRADDVASSRAGRANFSVFCNHVTIVPAMRAILDSPDMRIDGFIGPGHVSTVTGCRPYEFIARDYGCPSSLSGFEPVDILQSIVMVAAATARRRGEGRKSVQPNRAVGRQPGGAAGDGRESSSCGPISNGAGWASFRSRRCASARHSPRGMPKAMLRDRGVRVTDPRGGPVRRSAQGRAQAAAVQAVRNGVHSRASDRRADGLERRRVRRILSIRRLTPPTPIAS